MTLEDLLDQIVNHSDNVEFAEVIDVIHSYYNYTPTRFLNGKGDSQQVNEPGSNEGSCKIFAFALLHELTKIQTLNCFGRYYRDDVLSDPTGTGHGNIRAFMVSGWDGVSFDSPALVAK